MPLYPGATLKLLPENETQSSITPRVLIYHSQACGCGDSLYDDFNRAGNTLESHMFFQHDGGVEQYMDTNVRADANLDANDFAISCETQDDGNPDTQPWQPAQIDSMVEFGRWALSVHPTIAVRLCDGPYGSGIGYHTMWGAPSAWTPVAKTCPGAVRIQQFYDEVLPRILESDMPLTTADLDAIASRVRGVLNEGTGTGQASWAATSKAQLSTEQSNFNLIAGVNAKVDIIDAALDALALSTGLDPDALADTVVNRIVERLAS